MPGVPLQYSLTKVRRAGQIVKETPWTLPPDDRLSWAFDVLDNWRACHAYPMAKAIRGLRSRVQTVGAQGAVSQRLKRHDAIMNKLARIPGMKLDRMQDIAGCRAVLDTLDEVRAVERRWGADLVKDRDDYVAEPKSTGYRAVHLIVVYDDRKVEVQLRTRLQQEWAVEVERVGGRMGVDLKSGYGPDEVLQFFATVAEAHALEDEGQPVPDDLADSVEELRQLAYPLMTRRETR